MSVEEKLGTPDAPWYHPVAYVWLSYVASLNDNTVELHLCSHRDWKGKWITPHVMREVYKIMKSVNARYILALHADKEYRGLLKRLGFTLHGDFVNILDLENKNVIFERNLRRGRDSSFSSGATS
jgi:GNAT superfamily N-acetyltransferase